MTGTRFAASSWSAAWRGLATPSIEGKFSLRAGPTGEIAMADVFWPAGQPLSRISPG